jgi:hypothetical protein
VINQTLESALLQANILQNVKQDLLEEFQTAAALHIGLQKLAGIINEMLGGEWNVLWRVMQLSTFHDIEREWIDSDLDVFISGLELYNCTDGNEPEHLEVMMARLRYDTKRQDLIKRVGEAVLTQRRFWDIGHSIALTLSWPLHEVFGRLSAFAEGADSPTDLTEEDLTDFLSREPLTTAQMPSNVTCITQSAPARAASCENEKNITKNEIQEAIDSLEEQGLLRKTGDFRRGMNGDLQPVYVATPVAKWLEQTGLIDEFNEYLGQPRQKKVQVN